MPPDHPRAPDGAWGVRFPELFEARRILSPAPPDWPAVAVNVTVDPQPPQAMEWGPDHARYALLGGNYIAIQREPLHVELVLRRAVAAECVVAPHLSSAASTIGLWRGRQVLHAGAFVHDEGVWLVLGEKGSGKSSTLGWLARAGAAIMTDDLVVCERGMVLAGPRCVDLRPESAYELETGRYLGVVGTRERWRIDLPPCPPQLPLRGWVVLEWGPAARIDRIAPAQRLERLVSQRALQLPWMDSRAMLDLATLPALSWQRPWGWQHMKLTAEELLLTIHGI